MCSSSAPTGASPADTGTSAGASTLRPIIAWRGKLASWRRRGRGGGQPRGAARGWVLAELRSPVGSRARAGVCVGARRRPVMHARDFRHRR
jgi:hypothetical protein